MLTSDQIKDMQRQLKVKADGILGPNTIKALQRKIGVAADGKIGPATIAALKKAGATLWASEFQQQLTDAKAFFTASKSPYHEAKPATATKPATPAVFHVPEPLHMIIDTAKLKTVGVGLLVVLFVAVAAGSRKKAYA